MVDIATGAVDLWFSADRRFQPSQFHPTDPRRLLVAQDHWHDDATGERQHWVNRIWILDEATGARPLFPDDGPRVQVEFHEWWSADGADVYYVDVGWGTGWASSEGGDRQTVWPGGTCHSHATADGSLLVGDVNTSGPGPRAVPGGVLRHHHGRPDRHRQRMGRAPAPGRRRVQPRPPRFVLDDELIAYTTTALGGLDLALVRVADLLARTRA